jgi:hypothetical protein
LTLPERIVALHRALAGAGIEHAVGGAIALAYWTLDPRATSDIDLNVFVPSAEADHVLEALPDGVSRPEGTVQAIERDGQVRIWWDRTPLDLFFAYAPIHAEAARHTRIVPFARTEIPVLGPVELAVFKAMFDRTRDWADIEALAAAGTLDVPAIRGHLEAMLGEDDQRLTRVEEAARRGSAG